MAAGKASNSISQAEGGALSSIELEVSNSRRNGGPQFTQLYKEEYTFIHLQGTPNAEILSFYSQHHTHTFSFIVAISPHFISSTRLLVCW